jgi:hypothetical protein
MGRKDGKRVSAGRGAVSKAWEPSPEQLEVYARVIKGDKTQAEVAKSVGVTQPAISRLVSRIDRWLAPQWMDNIRQIKAGHTSRLMHIFKELMSGWENSKKRHRATRQSTPGADGTIRQVETIEIRAGDPNFLKGAIEALEQIRIMWGMNAPEKVEGETTLRVGGLNRSVAIEKRRQELEAALVDSQKAQEELNAGQGDDSQG